MAMNGKGGKKGPAVRRAKVGDSSAIEKLKALIPALKQFLNEESDEPQHQEEQQPEAVEQPENQGQGGEEQQPEAVEQPENQGQGGEEQQPEAVEQPENQGQGGEEQQPEAVAEAEDESSLEDLISKVEAILNELKGEKVGDEVSGLVKGNAEDCDNNGKASVGPVSGKNAGANVGDAAVRRSIYADIDKKNKLYERVSPIIGAFDHALMTAEDMAAYAAKKLKINAPRGMAAFALDSYLKGVEQRSAASKTMASVGDSAFAPCDPIDSYISGGNK